MTNNLIKEFLGRRFGMFIHWGVYSMLGGDMILKVKMKIFR